MKAPILAFLNFDLVFEVSCDTSNIIICVMLSQEGYPITFFSEKLNDAKLYYFIDNKEFYVIVQALWHWIYYLLLKEFVLYLDHEALKHLNFYKLIYFFSSTSQATRIVLLMHLINVMYSFPHYN